MKNQAAVALGRIKSDKKAAAARENGKRFGGRKPNPDSRRQRHLRLMVALEAAFPELVITTSNGRTITLKPCDLKVRGRIENLIRAMGLRIGENIAMITDDTKDWVILEVV